MGYYTDYSLIVTPDDNEALSEELTGDRYSGNYIGYFETYEGGDYFLHGKWYDHEEDMKSLSTKYPDHVFQLEGNGEETGDHWVKYFKNGQFYTVSLTLPVPEFDETKLGTHDKVRGY